MPDFTVDWFSHHTPVWQKLLSHLAGKEGLRCLEIGSFEGRSTLWLLENVLTAPSAHLYCIDTFEGGEDQKDLGLNLITLQQRFTSNVLPHLSKLTVLKELSQHALPLLQIQNKKFDFIYIDGSHLAPDVLVDSIGAWQCCKSGGLVLWDDYLWSLDPDERRRPKLAIDSFISVFQDQLDIVHNGYQLAVRKK